MKACLGVIDRVYNELLNIAEDLERSLNHGDLGPGDDQRDGQLFFVLKVDLVDTNCGVQLWRKLTQEYEPKKKSRHLSPHQAILNFKFTDDVMASFDQFEREGRQCHAIAGKHIDEDTMSGVILEHRRKASTRDTEILPTTSSSMLTASTLATRCLWKSARSSVRKST